MRHDLYRHRGAIRIDHAHVEELPEWFLEMMTKIIVLRVEYKFEKDEVEFYGLCELFRRIGDGYETPGYVAVIRDDHFAGFEPC